MSVRVHFVAGPCDGASVVVSEPLPSTLRVRPDIVDVVAAATGEDAELIEVVESLYRLHLRDGDDAFYMAGRQVPAAA